MKLIHGLSCVAIVSSLGINSGAAVARATEQASNSTSPVRSESVLIAGLFDDIQEAIGTVEQGRQILDTVTTIVDQENQRREQEAAREAAIEQERLEAERRRQYFESLSPEQRQAYIEEQRARQAQQDQAAMFLIEMLFGGSGSTQEEGGRSFTCSQGTDPNGGDLLYQVYVQAGESPPDSSCQ